MQQIVECSKPFIETERWYCYGEIINDQYINNVMYKGLIANTVEQLVSELNFTPRMIEKLFMRVKLTIESLNDDDLLLPEVIFILNALYICDRKAFDLYVNAAPYNANLDALGIKINKIYPYWTGVLNNFNNIFSEYQKSNTIKPFSKEMNVASLLNLLQQPEYIFKNQFRKKLLLDQYLKSYPSKIEFIGSMD